ncbi:MAG: SDR family NAD(P)-dependent oxidoreductase [Roseibium sp.]
MAEDRFTGKTVMITGAAGGFGREAAREFAAEGARLALSDHNKTGLQLIVEEITALGAEVLSGVLDVTKEEQVETHISEIIGRFGSLDIAFNNAGIAHDLKPLPELSVTDLDRVLAVNVRGIFLCMKHQIPLMQKAGTGSIINMASASGLVGAGHLSAYAASKHAVVGLTKAAADENGKTGVRINAVCPFFAATPMYERLAGQMSEAKKLSMEETETAFTRRSPMGRVITAAEVANTVLWLADPNNSAVHGQAIAIDGGLTAV